MNVKWRLVPVRRPESQQSTVLFLNYETVKTEWVTLWRASNLFCVKYIFEENKWTEDVSLLALGGPRNSSHTPGCKNGKFWPKTNQRRGGRSLSEGQLAVWWWLMVSPFTEHTMPGSCLADDHTGRISSHLSPVWVLAALSVHPRNSKQSLQSLARTATLVSRIGENMALWLGPICIGICLTVIRDLPLFWTPRTQLDNHNVSQIME